ncbi:RimJ/RimL family protein N-acetyltransferase [Pedobacter psychrotolerans]|uniref:Acetyltransferase n=1 Tax=Pedobacter psychrotolerans TaxID=1843235 RepID=A0A4R2H9I4_9SPHI|nr:GNAT family N-acetyltransferase [Pedobacter psychrotolerans]TCO23729.1 RimJ/RimL family protein N-acetyltransferase [Pedobacter psychrotolerans]GGE62126.1 putative acetyltransferase [Pedobacter psychrotolerans]
MNFDLQPTLEDNLIKVVPLKETDFENLYAVAADPLIWEQHPNKDRFKREVFEIFFKGAMDSKGAFIIYDQATGEVVGSSRYYELNEEEKSIAVGYTFIGRKFWAKGYNTALKKLMFDYAFQFADQIILHIGATNFRSQKATEKLGAIKTAEIEVAYYGEPVKWNFLYQINKITWNSR